VNITGRSPESCGKLHGNVASHTRGESCFTLPQITSEGAITLTAGRTNGRHGVVWKERFAAARNTAAGAVRSLASGFRYSAVVSGFWEKTGHPYLAAPGARQRGGKENQ
jgi:hypothetical protein